MKNFKHRSWNHICWTFHSNTGTSKMFLNGELQGSFMIDSEFMKKGIPGPEETFEQAFIIGQEPDAPSVRGGFDKEQVFVGDITELNMWNYTLTEQDIQKKGTCKNFDKGNIISWNLDNFIINEVEVDNLEEEELCNPVEQLLVFPKRVSWSTAWTLCRAHGGSIFSPNTKEENNELVDTMVPHQEHCADPVSSNIAWLGIKSKEYVWYRIHKNNSLSIQDFTNWEADTAPYFANFECGFMRVDGAWDSDTSCDSKVKLCTACKISGTPVFILKGTCNESPLDWLFYITKDNDKSIFYEGYRSSKIVQTNNTWHLMSKQESSIVDIQLVSGKESSLTPLGRNKWTVLNPACGIDTKQERGFSISVCFVGEEFSCDSGECVNIFQRCDNNQDCLDGSDEKDCNTIRVPGSYQKSAPPELSRDIMQSNPIFTQIDILNIDFIDTVRMSAGLTIEIQMTWRDHKLMFENILPAVGKVDSFKIIAEKEFNKIWLPMPDIIHENAVIGKVIEDKVFYVKIVGKSNPLDMTLEEDIEGLLYPGSANNLVISQRFKLEYRCEFFLRNYPFDKQTCNFILMVKLKGNNSIELAEDDPAVVYNGPRILREFEIKDLLVNTTLAEYQTRFIYSIRLERLYMQTLTTTFFQSFLLSIIAYSSFFINITDFSNRFMGALTSLLVLAALLSSINSTLPQTAYFKHIDFWFFFFIIAIVIMIFVHIIVDIFIHQEKDAHITRVTPMIPESPPRGTKAYADLRKQHFKKRSVFLNKWAKIFIPISILIFIASYFEITFLE